MIRLPKYGRNIQRYADAAFDAAWREVVVIGIPGVREYLSSSNPECTVSFALDLKFGATGLIGATVMRLDPFHDLDHVYPCMHIRPLWECDWQRREWRQRIYDACVSRYVQERYTGSNPKRPLYGLSDDEVRALIEALDVPDPCNFMTGTQNLYQREVAYLELDHRANESNHARLERLAAQKESA